MQAKEIMTKGVDSVTPETTIQEAARKMERHNVGILPVSESGELKGLLTDRDIAVRAAARGVDPAATKVSDIMSKNPVFCHEDDDIKSIAKLMEANRVRRLPILNKDERLVGIVSLGDLGAKGAGHDVVAEVLEAVAARHF